MTEALLAVHCTAEGASVLPEGANPHVAVVSISCLSRQSRPRPRSEPVSPAGAAPRFPHPGGLMVVLYLFARVLLGFLHLLVKWRVSRLEKRYVRLAAEADALLAGASKRGGTNRSDPFAAARHQLDLA